MKYFDKIHFGMAMEIPKCTVHVNSKIRDNYSLEFIAEGEMYFSMDDKPQRILHGPCLHWHNIGHNYCYGPVDESKGWRHLFFIFHGPWAKQIIEEALMDISPECFLEITSGPKILPLFQEIIELLNTRNIGYIPKACLRLEDLIVCLDNQISTQNISLDHNKAIENLIKDIRNNPTEKFTPEMASQLVGLSVSHFRKLFKIYLGKPFHQFVQEMQMQQAVKIIYETNSKIKEVAEYFGYEELSDFSRTFKRVMGVSPKKYRENTK